ncbi:MAG: hypothetical protein NZM26_05545, partial [Patescibacteria group bacterium]|nr:hypothetical protein [Patescibacteria group bacterium]
MNNSSYIKDIWSGIFLGLIEGLTEFLPVSSTAHLILASKLLDLKQELLVTNSIIVQASSVAALLIYFGRLVKSEETFFDKHFLRNSLVCSGVFISVALAFESVIKAALFSVNGIIVGLTLGSILMIVGTLFKRERRYFGVQKSLLLG